MRDNEKRIYEIIERTKDKPLKKAKTGYWFVYGFLVCLVDNKIITEDKYKEIRDNVIDIDKRFYDNV